MANSITLDYTALVSLDENPYSGNVTLLTPKLLWSRLFNSSNNRVVSIIILSVMVAAPPLIFIAMAIDSLRLHRKRDSSLRTFALTNGFSIGLGIVVDQQNLSTIMQQGSHPKTDHYFSGHFHGMNFDFFQHKFTPTDGRDRKKEDVYTGIRLELPKTVPNLILDSHINDDDISNLPVLVSDDQRLDLEGDFNKYFDYYAPEGYSIEALDLLSPEFMALLIDTQTDFDLELTGQSAYVFINKSYLHREEIQNLLEAAYVLSQSLSYKLSNFSFTPQAKNPPMLKLRNNDRAVKIGGLRFSASYFTKAFAIFGSFIFIPLLILPNLLYDETPLLLPLGIAATVSLVGAFIWLRAQDKS